MSRRTDDDRTKVVVYTNSPYKGGAEITLGEVLAGLPERFDVTVAGVVPEVIEWLAGHRSSMKVELLPAISGRNDLGPMIAHARAFRRLSPDILHFNLGIVSASQWAIFIAVLKGRYKTLVVENSPVDAWTSTSERLKRFTSPRLSAHAAVSDATARAVEKIAKLKAGSVETLHHGVRDVSRDVPRERHVLLPVLEREPPLRPVAAVGPDELAEVADRDGDRVEPHGLQLAQDDLEDRVLLADGDERLRK